MRIGLDGFPAPELPTDPFDLLGFVHEQGLDGYFFGSPLTLSPTLDGGYLLEVRSRAAELGLYVEIGIGNVNPARFGRLPAVAGLGEGDYRRGFERLMRAGVAMGCRELRVDMGGEGARFDPDVSWTAQLEQTRGFLASLTPLCRDLGCRLDVETHADVTTFELLRLIEAVGGDVVGVCLDTANVLCRAEDPVAAACRVAPYVHQTHVKDAILFFDERGLMRQSRPCGEGCIDWHAVLPALAAHSPDLTLSIEDHKGLFRALSYEPAWLAAHPDLTPREIAELVRLARDAEARFTRGDIAAPEPYEAVLFGDQAMERLRSAIGYLRSVLATHGI